MLKSKIFIREGSSINRLSSGAIMISEVSSLSHEVWDDTMEMRIFVSESFFVSAESSEVGCSLRGFFIEQLED